MNKTLNDYIYVVIDVETTGVARTDRICEIGMTKIDQGEITDKLETLLHPDTSITNTVFHGIENWMVKDAPRFEDVATQITEFIQGTILIAHNAPFDMRFMRYELQRLNRDLSHYALCTLKIARKLHPRYPSHRLEHMLNEYSIINECPHRAGTDADSEARLFLGMKEKLESNGMETLNSFEAWGLPYDHRWLDTIDFNGHGNGGKLLTRDDLI